MEFVTYLSFDGDCEAAFKFYERIFGGRILMLARYGEAPSGEKMPAVQLGRIMHARLKVGNSLLMGGDCMGTGYVKPQGICAHIKVDTAADAERIFAGLSEDGTVMMPMAQTFWALRFGMVTDRFGVPWMVNCEASQLEG